MTDDNSTLTVEFENPSFKDQLVAAAIAVGTALAVPVALGAGFLVVSEVGEFLGRRKEKKAAKKALALETKEKE